MAEIRLQNVRKAFSDFVAVNGSTFTVEDGEFFCLLGPSGCGKTTTLRMIAGLELPSSGKILLGGEDVTFARAARRDIAFVFQLFALYPHLSVDANIAYPLRCQGTPRGEARRLVSEAARTLRIEHLLARSVSGLSSGDRQRVALGRAIVRKPLAFLLDEPLGALDAELREIMCGELRSLHDRLGATMVYVTHDQLEAMSMADTIVLMRDGVVEQKGTPQEIYDRPANMFAASFVGSPSMNFVPFRGRLAPGDRCVRIGESAVRVPEAREGVAETDLVLGARPEHVRLCAEGSLRAEVLDTEYLGTTQIVTLSTEQGATLKARLPAEAAVRRGDRPGLAFRPEKLSLFDKASGRALRSALHEGVRGDETEGGGAWLR
jgi:multiple sugar transport system ATP-binding protein